jgi:hypothetical protein
MNKKSDGVQDMVRWMNEQIKIQRERVLEAKNASSFSYDQGESIDRRREEETTRLRTMVEWKISTEKYMKKLRHQAE